MATNGSDDDDDLYRLACGWPGAWRADPECNLVAAALRPLMFWQLEYAAGNSLRLRKDRQFDTVLIDCA